MFAIINTHDISQGNIVRKRLRFQGVLIGHQRGILIASNPLPRLFCGGAGINHKNILILFSQVFPPVVAAHAVRNSPFIPFHHGTH